MEWYLAVLKKYAVFYGRARRKEYWISTLVHLAIICALTGIRIGVDYVFRSYSLPSLVLSFIASIYLMAILVPVLAVSVRRLHDTGRTGFFLILGLIPLVGGIILLIYTLQDSFPGENQYGPNPKETAPDAD
ncbi:MAG: DUF805 domain-containing protein [Spirochaetaceae bacterium]|jgi:uncharacterized membrane protein YhaH (DUF805 family)|nr:DUF805 domain-containing protein [Spirochaetaceae bacterium]